jgi:hypothetical protein
MPLPLVSTRIGLSVTENPDPSENVKDIGKLVFTPLAVTVMGVIAMGEVMESEVIANVATVTVAEAAPDFVVSWVLVAVTVTGLVLGTALGAV